MHLFEMRSRNCWEKCRVDKYFLCYCLLGSLWNNVIWSWNTLKTTWCENKINSSMKFFFRGRYPMCRTGERTSLRWWGQPPGKYKGNDLWLIVKVCPKTKAFTILKLKKKKIIGYLFYKKSGCHRITRTLTKVKNANPPKTTWRDLQAYFPI